MKVTVEIFGDWAQGQLAGIHWQFAILHISIVSFTK